MQAWRAAASIKTLFLDEMRKRNPRVVFVHLHHGTVPDIRLADRPGIFGWLTRIFMVWVLVPVLRMLMYVSSVDVPGRGCFSRRWLGGLGL